MIYLTPSDIDEMSEDSMRKFLKEHFCKISPSEGNKLQPNSKRREFVANGGLVHLATHGLKPKFKPKKF